MQYYSLAKYVKLLVQLGPVPPRCCFPPNESIKLTVFVFKFLYSQLLELSCKMTVFQKGMMAWS